MVKIKKHIVNPAAAGIDTRDLNLSLLIGTDRFSYLTWAHDRQILHGIGIYEFDKTEKTTEAFSFLMSEDHLLSCTFKNVSVYLPTSSSTGVGSQSTDEIEGSYTFKDCNYIHYYSNSRSLFHYFQNLFPAAQISDHSLLLLKAFIHSNAAEQSLMSFWQSGRLFVTVLKNGCPLGTESFTYQKAEDALYYILGSYARHQLSPDSVKLYIAGDLLIASGIYKLLYMYIRDISFLNCQHAPALPDTGEDSPEHLFFDILATAL